jgi:hypothetical protein
MSEWTAAELKAIADEIGHDAKEARRWRARTMLAEKLETLSGLLDQENAIMARIGELQQRAEEITATNAAGDQAQRRLDGLAAEVARKEEVLLKRAQANADEIVQAGWAKAETIELETKRKNEEATRTSDEDLRRRQNEIAGLDRSIAERERRLANINTQIERLRAKIVDD